MSRDHNADPKEMDGDYLVQLALELWERKATSVIPMRLWERSFELKAEIERRLESNSTLERECERLRGELQEFKSYLNTDSVAEHKAEIDKIAREVTAEIKDEMAEVDRLRALLPRVADAVRDKCKEVVNDLVRYSRSEDEHLAYESAAAHVECVDVQAIINQLTGAGADEREVEG